ncbi:mitochondrial ATPase (Afg1), putative [Talaromyces stipitatus ATCC 10500]|uniref:Mitochondrial ATPase (Afg1), putative n=1 Tax=Talaromyces stipitatus (strain ATCC 10500 / CBS 375.48 / QM 6759 / NRRL 1006) TaxID=441959 RepID=B8MDR8_TALSN|nr:mitochondrial ATPase (Afg1), putative [Talaromyces stipitatus ATCC 10500]EED18297.1 mitochondrial ATPase (Afg1), putative [Talaromyces stipitatus ATCC 10500]
MNKNSVTACAKYVHSFPRATASRAQTVSPICRPTSSKVHSVNRALTISRYESSRAVSHSSFVLNKSCRIPVLYTPYSIRSLATAHATSTPQQDGVGGPIHEYERRVKADLLRDDPHQRSIINHLQCLHDMLKSYTPPPIVHPSPDDLQEDKKSSFLSSLFKRGAARSDVPRPRPENLPKGLYMYGDVGCGKTMLMDLFYDTIPPNIKRKKRIHFHNFMQGVHKDLHAIKKARGREFDALPMVAADIAEIANVLCFDEFQCTDIADAMILRRFLELLMSHGVVMVTTSNRHPDDLYKNGIQREHFIPCIKLLKRELEVLNLNSETDYRKIPRPPSGVYHHPLDKAAEQHAQKWFEYLGDPVNDPPHPATHEVWGRQIPVPAASGRAAKFTFQELIGRASGAADYLELVRHYDAFIVTDVPGMTIRERDWARRFITFIDAVYESKAKLVLTSAVPLQNLFMSEAEIKTSIDDSSADGHEILPSDMRQLMDDLGLSMAALKSTSIFSGDEERFAFARALSRLTEMGSKHWVERGMGVGMNAVDGLEDRDAYNKTRSRWSEDSM